MKYYSLAILIAGLVGGAAAFATSGLSSTRALATPLFAYVPDGLTKEQWEKIKKKENEQKKNLGGVGPRGFKSRSMQSFQEAMERGEAEHLLPVFNAKERVKRGELKVEDIPYMQRGGSWVSYRYSKLYVLEFKINFTDPD